MSSLRDKLKRLSFFTHYPRNHETLTIEGDSTDYQSKKEIWDTWSIPSNYMKGAVVFNGDINVYDQSTLTHTGGIHGCQLMYSRASTTSNGTKQYYWKIYLYNYQPYTFHSSQYAELEYTNANATVHKVDKVTIGATRKTIYSTDKKTSTSVPTDAKQGSFTLTIYPYYDSANHKFYTGVKYSVSFSSLTTSYKNFTVTYESLGSEYL